MCIVHIYKLSVLLESTKNATKAKNSPVLNRYLIGSSDFNKNFENCYAWCSFGLAKATCIYDCFSKGFFGSCVKKLVERPFLEIKFFSLEIGFIGYKKNQEFLC
jgi:hypothetical protein